MPKRRKRSKKRNFAELQVSQFGWEWCWDWNISEGQDTFAEIPEKCKQFSGQSVLIVERWITSKTWSSEAGSGKSNGRFLEFRADDCNRQRDEEDSGQHARSADKFGRCRPWYLRKWGCLYDVSIRRKLRPRKKAFEKVKQIMYY